MIWLYAWVGIMIVAAFGLTMVTNLNARRTLASKDGLIEAQNDLIRAKDRHIAALQEKADVLEDLANEREKTLVLYRKMEQQVVPLFGTLDRFSHTPDQR